VPTGTDRTDASEPKLRDDLNSRDENGRCHDEWIVDQAEWAAFAAGAGKITPITTSWLIRTQNVTRRLIAHPSFG
jgi:hypothetical protein